CAISAGLPVVKPSFLRRCAKLGYVPEVRGQDLLKDRIGEGILATRFCAQGYNLAEVCARAATRRLLKDFKVFAIRQANVMERSKVKALVLAAGGTWLEDLPELRPGDLLTFGPSSPEAMYDLEALLEAACTQRLRLEAFKLKPARSKAQCQPKKR
ncbi:unnamed protein product, partial [Durusdinium trenchii]